MADAYWEKIWMVLLCSCLLLSACSQKEDPVSESKINTVVQMQGMLQPLPLPLSSDFIGSSIETSQLCDILSLDGQNTGRYEQLYKNLGSGTLHIGGHSADLSIWEPDGIPYCKANGTVITQSLVNDLFAFARRINWHVIWGLNLLGYNPQIAASEAAYVAQAGGSSLIAFTMGNEPDLWAKHGWRPPDWGYENYRAEWDQYRLAVLQTVPFARFIGPELATETSSFFAPFMQDEGSGLIAASHHYYTTVRTTTGTDAPSIPFILSSQVAQTLAERIAQWQQDSGSVPVEITEANSISGGGTSGISDVFASALWATDLLLQAAASDIKSIDFQSASKASYNAIDDNGTPRPLYYGLLFFHKICPPGAMVTSLPVQSNLNLTAYIDSGK